MLVPDASKLSRIFENIRFLQQAELRQSKNFDVDLSLK